MEDIVACTNVDGSRTYLGNSGDAVWSLHSLTTRAAEVSRWEAQDLDDVARETFPDSQMSGTELLVPGEQLIVEATPRSIEWLADAPLTYAWLTYSATIDQAKEAGTGFIVQQLRKSGSPLASASLACAIAANDLAKQRERASEAEAQEVLFNVFSAAGSATGCVRSAREVSLPTGSGRQITLAAKFEGLIAEKGPIEKAAKGAWLVELATKYSKAAITFFK